MKKTEYGRTDRKPEKYCLAGMAVALPQPAFAFRDDNRGKLFYNEDKYTDKKGPEEA